MSANSESELSRLWFSAPDPARIDCDEKSNLAIESVSRVHVGGFPLPSESLPSNFVALFDHPTATLIYGSLRRRSRRTPRAEHPIGLNLVADLA
jgi:hypothetical protein